MSKPISLTPIGTFKFKVLFFHIEFVDNQKQL